MAYPIVYTVTFNYGGVAPGDYFPGTRLEADFAGLFDSVNDVSEFIRNVIRADGALNNGVVTFDSLSPGLQFAAGGGALVYHVVSGPDRSVDETPVVWDGLSGQLVKDLSYDNFKINLALVKSDVGLSLVDNTADASKPVSTAQAAALALKAPLASPALTGAPTAPTAALGTNTTQIATMAAVQAAVAALLNGAPGALDTLKELADAINDDASYAATIVAALALKAPLLSPALTTPAITGGTIAAVTSFGVRSTGAGGHDMKLSNFDNLPADVTLFWALNGADKSVNLGGNLSTSGAFTILGSFATIFRVSAATDLNFPTTGTLATLGSPAFTGTPTAPTATLGTNTTQIATMAAVQAAITALIGGSPGALDTLKELADAINDDASYAATITTALALKAPLASPTLTGTPAAPTAAVDTNSTQLATTAMVLAQAASATPLIDGAAAVGTSTRFARGDHVHPTDTTRAPLASPALTGAPTAPTASLGTNTTQIATMAAVQAAVAALLNGAPGALDTLKELADAINDDASYAATITTALALKAPLASPTLTGTPAAPTAAVDTNTTQLATTAMVLAQAASAAPLVNGAATVGTSTRFARGDHVHPTENVAWVSTFTPTISMSTVGGTPITSAVNSFRYKVSGKSIVFTGDVTISNIGVGNSGRMTFTLPATATSASPIFAGGGKEVATTGKGLVMQGESATVGGISFADATNAVGGGNGSRFQFGGIYEAA